MAFDVDAARRTLAIARDPETISPHDYHAKSACLDLLEEACAEVEELRTALSLAQGIMASQQANAVARGKLASRLHNRTAKLRAALEYYADWRRTGEYCARARAALKEDET